MASEPPDQETAFNIAMGVFNRWKARLYKGEFSHSDGVNFEQMLRVAFTNRPAPAEPSALPQTSKAPVDLAMSVINEWRLEKLSGSIVSNADARCLYQMLMKAFRAAPCQRCGGTGRVMATKEELGWLHVFFTVDKACPVCQTPPVERPRP